MFDNVCEFNITFDEEYSNDKSICESMCNGILKQGIFPASVKYWDYLKHQTTDFLYSNRTEIDILLAIYGQFYSDIFLMQSYYFRYILQNLSDQLENEIYLS